MMQLSLFKTVGCLMSDNSYSGHSAASNEFGTFPVYTKNNEVFKTLCPKCFRNEGLRHANWYAAKTYDLPLMYECTLCGSTGMIEELVLGEKLK